MFNQKNIITAVEIGTSKIAVLVGEVNQEGKVSIIGFHENPSNGTVCKGEIVEMDRLLAILSETIATADQAGGHMIGRSTIYVAVTSSGINSQQGEGVVYIESPDRQVSENDVSNAIENATGKHIKAGLVHLGTFDSFFSLDGIRKVADPVNQKASKLEANIHLLYGDEKRIENFKSAVYAAGFDQEAMPVFSPIADLFGVLSEDEKEHGVLMVNMGAGTTEYIVFHNFGVMLSGVLPVGLEHLANDLSLGLNLHINTCRKLLQEPTIAEHQRSGAGYIQIQEKNLSGGRQVPLNSIEKIIDLRLRETFGIIKHRVNQEGLYHHLGRGAIFTGGAALFEPAVKIFGRVFEVPIRIGRPFEPSGAVSALENPRYSTLWGLLKCGEFNHNTASGKNETSLGGLLVNGLDNAANSLFKKLGNIKKAIKF
ncbi:MAG: cell division protein FtsA [Victivallaceae bacterium]|nr:cell division protein FtsA [Victivallaceae bacterium]